MRRAIVSLALFAVAGTLAYCWFGACVAADYWVDARS